MAIQVQINIQSDDAGDFSTVEQAVLAALTGGQAPISDMTNDEWRAARQASLSAHEVGHKGSAVATMPKARTEDVVPADQSVVLDKVEVPEEKPKRKRRTKAEIEADEKAAAEADALERAEAAGHTDSADDEGGPAVLEDEKPVTEVHTEAELAEIANELPADDGPEITPGDALVRAKELIPSQAGARKVKAALDELGLEFVRNIATNEQAAEFIKLVS